MSEAILEYILHQKEKNAQQVKAGQKQLGNLRREEHEERQWPG